MALLGSGRLKFEFELVKITLFTRGLYFFRSKNISKLDENRNEKYEMI